ncbi:hypothetical protein BJ878DRAFT_159774 [Calycina marina]|uniref:Nucleoside 2-deoxyribosyltransferase domain-containing protein n=1 Tax=Calycina marina TaxID=1763456 RepID=A0A9P7Z0G7_9HELO|nr:hypothetical protein BJ878DRAFT_159774 [Calycina marina]
MAGTQASPSKLATVVNAPKPYTPQAGEKSIFLAGTVDYAAVDSGLPTWRETITTSLSHLPITVYNPHRRVWDFKEDINDPRFVEQTTWEMDMMDRATVVILFIHDREEKAPVSLLELGLGARKGKGNMVVRCPEGFWRRGNVQVVCQRFGIPMVESVEQVTKIVEKMLQL